MVAVNVRLHVVLGAIVYTERTARSLTQAQLAKAAGLHPMALSKIERGVQQDVGIETIQRIAIGLARPLAGVTAASLVATAERWQERLRTVDGNGEPTGATLAATIALLAGEKAEQCGD